MFDHWKLGKEPAKRDKRNIQFKDILRKAVTVPDNYDFDIKNPVPTPMFLNDRLGDCVIAGRAHETLRFELLEQGKVITIKDTEVSKEYFLETGGVDSGLVVLDSFKSWRTRGWKIGGRTYKIQAFTEINPKDNDIVKQAIFTNVGIGIGLAFPNSAMAQFIKGQPWDVVTKSRLEGGHYVYCPAYNKIGPVCVTWGRKQQMTWRFFNKYCEESYSIVDAKNLSKHLNTDKLNQLLIEATK